MGLMVRTDLLLLGWSPSHHLDPPFSARTNRTRSWCTSLRRWRSSRLLALLSIPGHDDVYGV